MEKTITLEKGISGQTVLVAVQEITREIGKSFQVKHEEKERFSLSVDSIQVITEASENILPEQNYKSVGLRTDEWASEKLAGYLLGELDLRLAPNRKPSTIEGIVRLLERKTGYHDPKAGGYEGGFREEWNWFEFGEKITAHHELGYDIMEDCSTADFNGTWEGEITKESMKIALEELLRNGETLVYGVEVKESYTGRVPYNERQNGERKYTTRLRIKIEEINGKIGVKVKNPEQKESVEVE